MRVPYRGSVFMNAQKRVDAMDALGIDLQLLSPNPLSFFGYINATDALSFARASNDAMVKHIDPFKNRLLGAASIPLQDPDSACKELERAVKDLGLIQPLSGVIMGPLDDPETGCVLSNCCRLGYSLTIHPHE